MDTVDLCSEQEATTIAGVSPRTLLRFSEAGYLTRHLQADGTSKYARAQVEEIFGTSSVTNPPFLVSNGDPEDAYSTGPMISESSQAVTSEVEAPQQDSYNAIAIETQSKTTASVGCNDQNGLESSQQATRDAEEIVRLRNLLSLQERILDSKDDEIADLRSQRAWLRERIERLEEKGDRDQILILSETQTIRSLIAYQESRKSTFRQFLEWAGLYKGSESRALPPSSEYQTAPPNQGVNSRAIEVSKAANS